MKKLLLEIFLLAVFIAGPVPLKARADMNVSIALPPPIVFAAPPVMIVLPETYVYVAPDINMDIFFYDGWWWRPWEGRWYRSRNYNSGWGYYRNVPSFYGNIPLDWRNDYRDHRWKGHQWNYERIPHKQVQQNWKGWKNNKHWEKQQTWGVQGLQPQKRLKQPSPAVAPHSEAVAKPKQVRPQSHEMKQERPQQHMNDNPKSRGEDIRPQQSHPRQEKEERGKDNKHDGK